MDLEKLSDRDIIDEYKKRFGASKIEQFSDFEISEEFYARYLNDDEDCSCDCPEDDLETNSALHSIWEKMRLGQDIGEEVRLLIWLKIGKHV